MNDNNKYINAVMAVDSDVSKTCRPAIAWLKSSAGNTVSFYGFIVGDTYFINQQTLKIHKKTDCCLINYVDSFDD